MRQLLELVSFRLCFDLFVSRQMSDHNLFHDILPLRPFVYNELGQAKSSLSKRLPIVVVLHHTPLAPR